MNVNEYVPDRILSIDHVLTESECKNLINDAEAGGFKPSPPSGGGHGQTPRTGARTSQFYVKRNLELANKLWTKVKNFVPKDLRSIKSVPYLNSVTRGDEYTPIGVSDHLRYYKYDPGQYILKHDDYRISRYRYDPETNKYYLQMTFLTLLVYLNDSFLAGQTLFWTQYGTTGTKGHCRFLREKEFAESDLQISPKTGMALINDHMVQHEGEAPQKGTKYILRTDIVHEKEIGESQLHIKFKKGETLSEWERHYEPSCLNYTE